MKHQGMIAITSAFQYIDFDPMIETALAQPGFALIVAADHITDEGNLGALIRTSAFFGAHGIILPKDRSAGITGRVQKNSAGAYAHVPIAKVTNLGQNLNQLKKKGFWIIGAAADGPDSIFGFDWRRDMVLVFGSEGRGLSRLVRERCHQLVHIPGHGNLDSLNISVAAGVIFSELTRSRMENG
jgi:23S rRNA (guanosine2251-2'-O)-methyltransferase